MYSICLRLQACRFLALFIFGLINVILSITPAAAAYQIQPAKSVARNWSEAMLEALRGDDGQVAVNARNVFHFSIAVYDAWAAYDDKATPFLLGKTVGGVSCPFNLSRHLDTSAQAQETAINHAAYRLLRYRFQDSAGSVQSLALFDQLFGYYNHPSASHRYDAAASLGDYIADCIINFGLQDGSNEQNGHASQNYLPVNPVLTPTLPGSINSLVNPDRWQNLNLDEFVTKTGNSISVPDFETPEWGRVVPFALDQDDVTTYWRNGVKWQVYRDPGNPPFISVNNPDALPAEYQWGFSLVAVWAGQLDPTVGHGMRMIDISPASIGDSPALPNAIPQHRDFYDYLKGGDISSGHSLNPITGQPYTPQMVPLGDYSRVLLQYWADGPFTALTPAGFMMHILNTEVSDDPLVEKRFMGSGPVLDDLEWDVKAYFVLSGALHDAAVAAWSIKGWYDYIRPISAIRYMADVGQSSNPADPDCPYHVNGIPYVDDPDDPAGDGSQRVIDCVRAGDPLDGGGANVGKIKIFTWLGPEAVVNPATDFAGVGWKLAENWWPMMRPDFVTPPFAGYISGHSTLTRAGAEVLTMLTGSPYFPDGMYQFFAEKDNFLVYEKGPSANVTLQWATYYDMADAAGISRLWGGVHPPVDDINGRKVGAEVGVQAFNESMQYFDNRPVGKGGGGSIGWLIILLLTLPWHTYKLGKTGLHRLRREFL